MCWKSNYFQEVADQKKYTKKQPLERSSCSIPASSFKKATGSNGYSFQSNQLCCSENISTRSLDTKFVSRDCCSRRQEVSTRSLFHGDCCSEIHWKKFVSRWLLFWNTLKEVCFTVTAVLKYTESLVKLNSWKF